MEDGHVKLTDFAIAPEYKQEVTDYTGTALTADTKHYMAPEIIKNQ